MARERAGPLEYSRKFWVRAWLVATFVFLYAPIAILIAFSFNDPGATSSGRASRSTTTPRPGTTRP